jgi:tRNA(fMet)-specific endonuclease VapC
MSYLIDTDIIVYSLKENKEINLHFKEKLHIPKSISVVTYGELIYGAKKSKHVEKNLAVAYRISELFPIINIDRSIMDIFGEIKSKLEKTGSRIEDMDLFIAATALSYNLTLVTNNTKHFENIDDLRLENWKEA